MNLVSINVGMPVAVPHEKKMVSTGIFKASVQGPVRVAKHNLEGDAQADLSVHGGVDKAVYAYSLDHYGYWQKLLGGGPLPYGQFGENFTIAGLDETVSCIGDQLQIGSALFVITQPRVPCFKLGIRFGNPEVPKLFTKSARTGFYLKVLRVGVVQAGDQVQLVQRGQGAVAVRKLFEAYLRPGDKESLQVLRQVMISEDLAAEWRRKIESRLA
jgi:MOSC domain-containing protein YiiM